jgi:orotidine-5'-phosphate decarboxylase
MTRLNPITCALDTRDLLLAEDMALRLKPYVGSLKLGLEFFMAHGAAGVQAIARHGLPIFLDLKLFDIPNTVAGGVGSLLPLRPAFLTIHTLGGKNMMRAAADAAAKAGSSRPKLLGVTALTSLDAQDLEETGQDKDMGRQVLRLARLARDSGLDGVVCAPEEAKMLRHEFGPDFVLATPGIRPASAAKGDQKRVMTPAEAIAAGSSLLVIGRPITAAPDPADAAARILAGLGAGDGG